MEPDRGHPLQPLPEGEPAQEPAFSDKPKQECQAFFFSTESLKKKKMHNREKICPKLQTPRDLSSQSSLLSKVVHFLLPLPAYKDSPGSGWWSWGIRPGGLWHLDGEPVPLFLSASVSSPPPFAFPLNLIFISSFVPALWPHHGLSCKVSVSVFSCTHSLGWSWAFPGRDLCQTSLPSGTWHSAMPRQIEITMGLIFISISFYTFVN